MAEIVNLRLARKRMARQADAAAAADQRLRFGRSKAERTQAAVERSRHERQVEGHRLQPASDDAMARPLDDA